MNSGQNIKIIFEDSEEKPKAGSLGGSRYLEEGNDTTKFFGFCRIAGPQSRPHYTMKTLRGINSRTGLQNEKTHFGEAKQHRRQPENYVQNFVYKLCSIL